jgi:nitrite reductase/ring-hydroxylating ferredoxin subunit
MPEARAEPKRRQVAAARTSVPAARVTSVAEPSARALICDLLGQEPDAAGRPRPTVAQARRLCPAGGVIACRRGDRALVLAVLPDGRAFTAPDRCPHDGRPLSDGFLDGERLVCARHGWEFDLATGGSPGRPAVRIAVREE